VRATRARRVQAEARPRLKWRGLDASPELQEYALRIASGEDLPPFRGPMLASREAAPCAPEAVSAGEAKAFVKVALALILMSAGLVAAAVLGDDAELRAAGQSISRWLEGPGRSFEAIPSVDPAQCAVPGPCEAPASAPAR